MESDSCISGRFLWETKPENQTGFPLHGFETHAVAGNIVFCAAAAKTGLPEHSAYCRRCFLT